MGQWNLTIDFEAGSFSVASGYGFAGRIDRALLKDALDLPYVPGSALKGKLRHAAREVATALDEQICEEYCLPGQKTCAVCSVFGSPFVAGKLFCGDARCTVRENPVLGITRSVAGASPRIWRERSATAIGRGLRVAEQGLRYSAECAPEGLVLHARLEGDLSEPEERLLRAACAVLSFIGGGSGRGLGGCRCQLT